MPMIDVYAPADMFTDEAERPLAEELMQAVMIAEGLPQPAPRIVQNVTGCYLHRLPPSAIHTARTGNARTVRINVMVGAGGLGSEAKKQVVATATAIVARHASDARQELRTFVIISEATEGGWGIAGETFGKGRAEAFFALELD